MKRIAFLTFCFLFTYSVFGQGQLLTEVKSSFGKIIEAFTVVNTDNNDISLFFSKGEKIEGLLINDKLDIKKRIIVEDKRRAYNEIIGASISGNDDYRVFLSNSRYKRFAFVNFSYGNSTSDFKEFKLNHKQEKLIQTVRLNNKFYLLTSRPKTSIINIYSFDDEGNYTVYPIDLSNETFFDKYGEESNLYNVILAGNSNNLPIITKVDTNVPNAIETVSVYNKLYQQNSKILISLDAFSEVLKLIEIDLHSYDYSVANIEKPLKEAKIITKSNSYIDENKLFTFSTNTKHLVLRIQDLRTKNIINEFRSTKEDTIHFKNTPIVQTGGEFKEYREMEKTRKFLRKTTFSDVGVSAYRLGGNYVVTVGGKKEVSRSGGGMVGFTTVPILTAPNGTMMFYNPVFTSFNAYSTTKAIHFKSYLDSSLNHIEMNIPKNVFDKIKEFEEETKNKQIGRSLFKYQDYLIHASYSSKNKTYQLRKFTN